MKIKLVFSQFLIACVAIFASAQAWAVLHLEVTGGIDSGILIAVPEFSAENTVSQKLSDVINSDLIRSGSFSPMSKDKMPVSQVAGTDVNIQDWQGNDLQNLVSGSIAKDGSNYVISFNLYDVPSGSVILSKKAKVSANNLRKYAHMISNMIYEKIVGLKGAFLTKIAYVSVDYKDAYPFRLVIADYDGYNEHIILRSKEPVMSPTWSPDGSSVAYVSFEKRKPGIWIQNIQGKTRQLITSFPGINGSPKWSPKGDRLALVFSKDGNPEIYTIGLGSKSMARLTNNRAIDTEPSWAPDGSIYFNSDRGGKPQIYRMAGGGEAQRVTWEGDANMNPCVSPDGKYIALITQSNGSYRVARLDLDTKNLMVLSNSQFDESPSIAPNGSMIIYSTIIRGRKGLALVSADGRFHANLPSVSGEVRAPAWSPFLN